MSLVSTIPETEATVPTFLRGAPNGQLPADWLRSFDGTTRVDYKLFVPVSYAMEAMHLAGIVDGIWLKTTGRYRTYARQYALFFERWTTTNTGRASVMFQGVRYYLRPGMARAAVPGTSNHGLAIADDISEDDTGDNVGESIDTEDLQWLKDNALSFGFALDIHEEPWHWHWWNRDALTQRTVDVLAAFGIKIEDLSRFGFSVPAPTNPQEDDDMTHDQAVQLDRVYTIMAGAFWPGSELNPPPITNVVAGELAKRIRDQDEKLDRILRHLGI